MNGLFKYILIMIITSVISLAHASNLLPEGIEVSISMKKTQLNSVEPLTITTTFTNTTSDSIKLLKWNTPFENNLKANLFDIRDSQLSRVKYIGKLIKRPAPEKDDYLVIQAGESINAVSDLSIAYKLESTGTYSIRYRNINETVSFALLEDRKTLLRYKEASQTECTVEQIDTLSTALPEATKIASTSVFLLKEVLEKNHPVTDRYTEWFGVYDNERYQTVLDGFNSINNILQNNEVVFNCSCDENAIAFVYPDIPYELHICPAFWELGLWGTDSQAGTIIHELTHFKTTVDANDYVYGKKKSLALAADFPEKALNNADNYEYFAENSNPYLAMYTATTADSHEPDNSKVTAKLITEANPQIHSIHTTTDADWMKFEILSSSYVNIHTIGPYKGDTELRLYNEAGEELAFGDDIDSTINNNYSEVGVDGLQKGTYYIKVNGYQSSRIVTEYKLSLTILPEGSGKTYVSAATTSSSSDNSSSGSVYWPTLILFIFIGIFRRTLKEHK